MRSTTLKWYCATCGEARLIAYDMTGMRALVCQRCERMVGFAPHQTPHATNVIPIRGQLDIHGGEAA